MTLSWDDLKLDQQVDEIVSASTYADNLGVQLNTLPRSSAEGTIPMPTSLTRTTRGAIAPLWSKNFLDDYYRKLHEEVVAYAGISGELGVSELDRHGIYVCPCTSHHIWSRRCGKLVLIRSGESAIKVNGVLQAEVYDVEYVQTDRGVRGERFADWRGNNPNQQKFDWSLIDRSAHGGGDLTLFKLDMASKVTFSVLRGVQRGGTLKREELQKALDNPTMPVSFRNGKIQ